MMQNFIRHYRKKRQITQMGLSLAIGASVVSIRRWENGSRDPRAPDILKLCKVLGCSEVEFLNGPTDTGFHITLKIVEKIDKTKEASDVMRTSGGTLTLDDDGGLFLSIGKSRITPEDKAEMIQEFAAKLEEGLDIIQRRQATREEKK